MSYIIIPSRRNRQPQQAWRIDWGNPLTRDLAFLVCYSDVTAQNLVNGERPVLNVTRGVGAPGLSVSAIAGAPFYGVAWTNSGIVTSDGAGTGGFTLLSYSAPIAEANIFAMLSQSASGSTPQCYLTANTGSNYAASSGALTIGFGGASLLSVAAMVDGRPHVFMGGRTGQAAWIDRDGIEVAAGSSAAYDDDIYTAGSSRIWASGIYGYNSWTRTHPHYLQAAWNRDLTKGERQQVGQNPWQLFVPPSPIWQIAFAPAAGGGATERTVAARVKARGAATTLAIHTETVAGKLKARAAEASLPTRIETIAGRRKSRGADTTTAIHAAATAGRLRVRAADATLPTRTETVAGRVKARGTNATQQLGTGVTTRTVAGRTRARGAATTLSIRNTTIVGRRKARGADAVTSTRLSLAAGRVRTRAAVAAAPVVAGMVTTTAAGRLRARGAAATTALRVAAVAGRVKARGTDITTSIRSAVAAGRLRSRAAAAGAPYVAPTLPVDIPPSSRTLAPAHGRIGAATVDRDSARLGVTPSDSNKPRLG